MGSVSSDGGKLVDFSEFYKLIWKKKIQAGNWLRLIGTGKNRGLISNLWPLSDLAMNRVLVFRKQGYIEVFPSMWLTMSAPEINPRHMPVSLGAANGQLLWVRVPDIFQSNIVQQNCLSWWKFSIPY